MKRESLKFLKKFFASCVGVFAISATFNTPLNNKTSKPSVNVSKIIENNEVPESTLIKTLGVSASNNSDRKNYNFEQKGKKPNFKSPSPSSSPGTKDFHSWFLSANSNSSFNQWKNGAGLASVSNYYFKKSSHFKNVLKKWKDSRSRWDWSMSSDSDAVKTKWFNDELVRDALITKFVLTPKFKINFMNWQKKYPKRSKDAWFASKSGQKTYDNWLSSTEGRNEIRKILTNKGTTSSASQWLKEKNQWLQAKSTKRTMDDFFNSKKLASNYVPTRNEVIQFLNTKSSKKYVDAWLISNEKEFVDKWKKTANYKELKKDWLLELGDVELTLNQVRNNKKLYHKLFLDFALSDAGFIFFMDNEKSIAIPGTRNKFYDSKYLYNEKGQVVLDKKDGFGFGNKFWMKGVWAMRDWWVKVKKWKVIDFDLRKWKDKRFFAEQKRFFKKPYEDYIKSVWNNDKLNQDVVYNKIKKFFSSKILGTGHVVENNNKPYDATYYDSVKDSTNAYRVKSIINTRQEKDFPNSVSYLKELKAAKNNYVLVKSIYDDSTAIPKDYVSWYNKNAYSNVNEEFDNWKNLKSVKKDLQLNYEKTSAFSTNLNNWISKNKNSWSVNDYITKSPEGKQKLASWKASSRFNGDLKNGWKTTQDFTKKSDAWIKKAPSLASRDQFLTNNQNLLSSWKTTSEYTTKMFEKWETTANYKSGLATFVGSTKKRDKNYYASSSDSNQPYLNWATTNFDNSKGQLLPVWKKTPNYQSHLNSWKALGPQRRSKTAFSKTTTGVSFYNSWRVSSNAIFNLKPVFKLTSIYKTNLKNWIKKGNNKRSINYYAKLKSNKNIYSNFVSLKEKQPLLKNLYVTTVNSGYEASLKKWVSDGPQRRDYNYYLNAPDSTPKYQEWSKTNTGTIILGAHYRGLSVYQKNLHNWLAAQPKKRSKDYFYSSTDGTTAFDSWKSTSDAKKIFANKYPKTKDYELKEASWLNLQKQKRRSITDYSNIKGTFKSFVNYDTSINGNQSLYSKWLNDWDITKLDRWKNDSSIKRSDVFYKDSWSGAPVLQKEWREKTKDGKRTIDGLYTTDRKNPQTQYAKDLKHFIKTGPKKRDLSYWVYQSDDSNNYYKLWWASLSSDEIVKYYLSDREGINEKTKYLAKNPNFNSQVEYALSDKYKEELNKWISGSEALNEKKKITKKLEKPTDQDVEEYFRERFNSEKNFDSPDVSKISEKYLLESIKKAIKNGEKWLFDRIFSKQTTIELFEWYNARKELKWFTDWKKRTNKNYLDIKAKAIELKKSHDHLDKEIVKFQEYALNLEKNSLFKKSILHDFYKYYGKDGINYDKYFIENSGDPFPGVKNDSVEFARYKIILNFIVETYTNKFGKENLAAQLGQNETIFQFIEKLKITLAYDFAEKNNELFKFRTESSVALEQKFKLFIKRASKYFTTKTNSEAIRWNRIKWKKPDDKDFTMEDYKQFYAEVIKPNTAADDESKYWSRFFTAVQFTDYIKNWDQDNNPDKTKFDRNGVIYKAFLTIPSVADTSEIINITDTSDLKKVSPTLNNYFNSFGWDLDNDLEAFKNTRLYLSLGELYESFKKSGLTNRGFETWLDEEKAKRLGKFDWSKYELSDFPKDKQKLKTIFDNWYKKLMSDKKLLTSAFKLSKYYDPKLPVVDSDVNHWARDKSRLYELFFTKTANKSSWDWLKSQYDLDFKNNQKWFGEKTNSELKEFFDKKHLTSNYKNYIKNWKPNLDSKMFSLASHFFADKSRGGKYYYKFLSLAGADTSNYNSWIDPLVHTFNNYIEGNAFYDANIIKFGDDSANKSLWFKDFSDSTWSDDKYLAWDDKGYRTKVEYFKNDLGWKVDFNNWVNKKQESQTIFLNSDWLKNRYSNWKDPSLNWDYKTSDQFKKDTSTYYGVKANSKSIYMASTDFSTQYNSWTDPLVKSERDYLLTPGYLKNFNVWSGTKNNGLIYWATQKHFFDSYYAWIDPSVRTSDQFLLTSKFTGLYNTWIANIDNGLSEFIKYAPLKALYNSWADPLAASEKTYLQSQNFINSINSWSATKANGEPTYLASAQSQIDYNNWVDPLVWVEKKYIEDGHYESDLKLWASNKTNGIDTFKTTVNFTNAYNSWHDPLTKTAAEYKVSTDYSTDFAKWKSTESNLKTIEEALFLKTSTFDNEYKKYVSKNTRDKAKYILSKEGITDFNTWKTLPAINQVFAQKAGTISDFNTWNHQNNWNIARYKLLGDFMVKYNAWFNEKDAQNRLINLWNIFKTSSYASQFFSNWKDVFVRTEEDYYYSDVFEDVIRKEFTNSQSSKVGSLYNDVVNKFKTTLDYKNGYATWNDYENKSENKYYKDNDFLKKLYAYINVASGEGFKLFANDPNLEKDFLAWKTSLDDVDLRRDGVDTELSKWMKGNIKVHSEIETLFKNSAIGKAAYDKYKKT